MVAHLFEQPFIFKLLIMRLLYKTLVVIMLNYIYVCAQQKIVVTYKAKFVGEIFQKKKDDKISEDLAKDYLGTEEKIALIEFELQIDSHKSLFKALPIMESDNGSNNMTMAKISLCYDDVYYRDSSSQTIIKETNLGSKKYFVKEKFDTYNWDITGEEKIIDGYKCYLAKTKFAHLDVYAWYCPSIPFSTGPRDYGNLPGLILELQVGKLYFEAKKIGFDNNLVVNYDLNKIKTISESEMDKIVNEFTQKWHDSMNR